METEFHKRYASKEMLEIWSSQNKFVKERSLWIAVMRAQAKVGFDIPESAIKDYESCREIIDLDSISEREKSLKHDVKARIEEFNHLAGHQFIHLGLTSRDVTENVELSLIVDSLVLTRFKSIALLNVLGMRIAEFKELPIVARTHNVPAQVTTLGKKFSVWAEELLFALKHLDELLTRIPMRGLKGAVGTTSDMQLLLGTSITDFESEIALLFGDREILNSTAQVYPRSIDFEVIASLVQLASSANNIALNLRILAGLGHVVESFSDTQVGSSAMPHKRNPRLSERINALFSVLKGYLAMIENSAGDQWNEGDVSCSATRRVALSGAFLMMDGIIDTTINVLSGIGVSKDSIGKELEKELPIIASSAYLMLMVKKGAPRELAHKQLGESLRAIPSEGVQENQKFIDLLVEKSNSLLDRAEILHLLADPLPLAGMANSQCDLILGEIKRWVTKEVDAMRYQPRQST